MFNQKIVIFLIKIYRIYSRNKMIYYNFEFIRNQNKQFYSCRN